MKDNYNNSFGIRLWNIFITFFKIGAFTFGGGYGMIPFIQRETVEKNKWISGDDMVDIVAIAESTPGPIAVNAATFIGYRVCGFWGAFFATAGVVLPSFFIILVISFMLREFQNLKAVKYAFFGIRAGVLALILKGLWTMYRQSRKSIIFHIILAGALITVTVWDINVLIVIASCAAVGLIYSLIAEKVGS